MVDLFKDIIWDDLLEDDVEDYGTLLRQIRTDSQAFQQSNEFLNEEIKKPKVNDTFENFLMLVGLPQVPQDKLDKIQKLLKGILKKKKLYKLLVNLDIEFPEEAEVSTGNVTLEFNSAESALNAERSLNGHDVTGKGTMILTACTFDRMHNLMKMDDKLAESDLKQRDDLYKNLEDDL